MAETREGYIVLTGPFRQFKTRAEAEASAAASSEVGQTSHVVLAVTYFPVQKQRKAPKAESE